MSITAERLVHSIPWPPKDDPDRLLEKEWLVTNGLGGYASGTVSGVVTRRYHGWLVAALPNPLGRVVMLTHLSEQLRAPDGRRIELRGEETEAGRLELHGEPYLRQFRLVSGLPHWHYELDGLVLEKRVLLPYAQNTVHVTWWLREGGPGEVLLQLRPSMHFRRHEASVSETALARYSLTAWDHRYEIAGDPVFPPLRLFLFARDQIFALRPLQIPLVVHRVEESRGYESRGDLWSPGYFQVRLHAGEAVTLVASTEPWEAVEALPPEEAERAELERRARVLGAAAPLLQDEAADLVLAADQFVITPVGRVEDRARAAAAGDELRTVIAGYHWFTDWGRDTMIALEGLCLCTGRHLEAGWILRMFASHVRDGLLPNLFPEGDSEGRYHTADATLWFFHAIDRYTAATGDRETLRRLLPTLVGIVEHHVEGTRFGIGVDPADGLLRAGAAGYQLTWMDAKVGDWVVTPRRGKPVEINALWHNALCLIRTWAEEEGMGLRVPLVELIEKGRESFNRRFWLDQAGHLLDVVDGEEGDDGSFRPNQLLAVSLPHPVLSSDRWRTVVEAVRDRLLTPYGLRTLTPGHPDYRSRYYGDLRARDAAYHQGTVWPWLIGPFIDAWLKVFPNRRAEVRAMLDELRADVGQTCIGSVNEIFDAEPPFTARGCVAQAWSVAEILRSLVNTA